MNRAVVLAALLALAACSDDEKSTTSGQGRPVPPTFGTSGPPRTLDDAQVRDMLGKALAPATKPLTDADIDWYISFWPKWTALEKEKSPQAMRSAIEGAGLSYAEGTLLMLRVTTAMAFLKMPEAKVPENVKADVEVVRRNQARLDALKAPR